MSDLREQLQAIYDRQGKLTAGLVVASARQPSSPLHSRFEWDNKIAGDAWREHQASELIRSVKIVYRRPNDSPGDVRAFHAVRTSEGHTYEPVEKIVADPLLAQMLLNDMKRDWEALKARYEQFDEFRQMVLGDLAVTEDLAEAS